MSTATRTQTETKAQRDLIRIARGFAQTPNSYWRRELEDAIIAVEEEAEEARQEREARYVAAQEAAPSWWDDASYAAYQARD